MQSQNINTNPLTLICRATIKPKLMFKSPKLISSPEIQSTTHKAALSHFPLNTSMVGLLLRPPLVVTAPSLHQPPRSPKVESRVVVALSLRSPGQQKISINPESLSSSSSALTTALQCQHFQLCSGCSQEWELDRPHVVAEARKFFEELGVSDFNFESGILVQWRCRAKLAVRGTFERLLIGLYEEDTHNVVDIPQCKAHHPSINVAVNLLKQGTFAFKIQPYDEDIGTGELRYVQFAVTTYNSSLPATKRYRNGKIQVSLVWNSINEHSESFEKLNVLAEFLWRNGGPRSNIHVFHSIWVNFQTSSSNIIFGSRWRHLLGERDFWEHIGGIDICLDPCCFGQANTQAFNSLLRKLHKYVPYGSSVVDMYAGAGVIGLSVAAARKCRSVRCIEINKKSKLSFEKSLSRLPKHIDCSIHWHNTDASIEPLNWLKGSNVVIVDPPRKGLEHSLLDALREISNYKVFKVPKSSIIEDKEEKRPWMLRAREATVHMESKTNIDWEKDQIWPEFLIYVSCGWESFKEDCRYLLSNNAWHLEKAHAFNFFPGTESIEILALFKRGPRASQTKKKSSGKKKSRPLKGSKSLPLRN